MAKKVAYVVFSGVVPGVYRDWADAEKQTKHYSGARFRGYTSLQGGRKQAQTDYEAHIESIRRANVPQSIEGEPALGTKEDAISVTIVGQSLSSHRSHSPNKRLRNPQYTDDAPAVKRQRSRSILQPVQPNASSDQRLEISEHDGKSNGLIDVHGSRASIISISSEDEQPSVKNNGTAHSADNIPLPASDSEDEYGCKSLDLAFSKAFSHICPESGVQLCQEQADLVDIIISGKNVFYTGSAGCGKSTVLKCFVKCLKELNKNVFITAPTGQAALNVQGQTFWGYAGWTPIVMRRPMEDLLLACHGKKIWKRLKNTHVLVIDEISMMENFHLERLNRVMKEARNDPRPFGGVQMVVSGDFCQLPPVLPMKYCLECGVELQLVAKSKKKCPTHGDCHLSKQWAFSSDAWRESNFTHVNLKTIHRQKDMRLIGMLEKLRVGKPLSVEEKDVLKNHDSQTEGGVKLFSRTEDVRCVNEREFNQLRTPIFTYQCCDDLQKNPKHENLDVRDDRDEEDGSLVALAKHRLARKVELRVGMIVVLLVNLNMSDGLVNGSQGRITKFEPAPSRKDFLEMGGEYAQYKKRMIHRFTCGDTPDEWPVVQFVNGVERRIYPHCMVDELGNEKPWSLLSRTQIPLMAAWAMTIHKAQGMTLDRVVVDLADTFEEGHDYVALSRARGLEGLKVDNLGCLDKGINPQVKEFLEEKFGLL